MSAIYRTLKRLRASSYGEEAEQAAWSQPAPAGSFSKRLFLSSRRVITSLAVIIVGGSVILLVYATDRAHTPFDPARDVSPASSLDPSAAAGIQSGNDMAGQGRPGKVFRASLNGPVKTAGNYIYAVASGSTGPVHRHRDGNEVSLKRGYGKGWVPTVRPIVGGTSRGAAHEHRQVTNGGEEIPEAYSPPEKETNVGRSPMVMPLAFSDEVKREGEGMERPGSGEGPGMDRIDRVGRPVAVIRLVSKIEKAMAAQDVDRAGRLIQELTDMKGARDSYVMKLTAFWHMNQNDFEKAASLLLEVLKQAPNDLEAGINMAIIDIKRGRLGKARKRLVELRENYPAHERVGKLIGQIGG